MIRDAPVKYTFKREPRTKQPKIEEIDLRTPLNPNLDAVKPRHPMAVVLPEHKIQEQLDLYQIKLGPGFYSQNYELVEKRTDIGVLEFQDLNERNKRENQMDLAKKDIFDGDLDPNYDYDKPNKLVPVYHEPVQLDGPAHIPDSKIHPEQWKFYDVNLDVVKPDLPEVLMGNGLVREEFLNKQQDAQELINYLRRKKKHPVIGQYDVKYDGVDPELKVPDFERYFERDNREIVI